MMEGCEGKCVDGVRMAEREEGTCGGRGLEEKTRMQTRMQIGMIIRDICGESRIRVCVCI